MVAPPRPARRRLSGRRRPPELRHASRGCARVRAGMGPSAFTLRWIVLVAAATVALHTARFAMDPAEAEAHGHMPLVTGAVIAALLAAAWRFVARLRNGGDADARPPRLLPLWGATTGLVLAVFAGQEVAEAVITPEGHGLAGLVGDGAWTVPLMAAGLGLGVALLLHEAQAALLAAALRAARTHRGPAPVTRRPLEAPAPVRAPLARRLAGRGPPLGRPAAA
jgi:hypothetical protein